MTDPRIIENAVHKMAGFLSQSSKKPAKPNCREIWRTLLDCVLSSQVPFAQAIFARVEVEAVLYSKSWSDEENLASSITAKLNKPLPTGRRYRFPNLRAKQIAASWFRFGPQCWEIEQLLNANSSSMEKRSYLVANVPGMGMKQASMFLRDLGCADDLAIIDRHILKYLDVVGLAKIPSNLGPKNYRKLEDELSRYAKIAGVNLGTFDEAVWFIVRAAAVQES